MNASIRKACFLGALTASTLFIGCAKDKDSCDSCAKPEVQAPAGKVEGKVAEVKTEAKAEAKSVVKAEAPKVAAADKPIESCEDMNEGAAPVPTAVVGGLHIGPALKMDAKSETALADLFKDPTAYNGKPVRLTGRINSVCQVKGCWLTFGDPKTKDQVFIKFTDPAEGFIAPPNSVGYNVVAEGTFKIAQVSEDFAKHMIEEGGGTEEDAEKIKGPQKWYVLGSAAVTIVDYKK